MLKVVNVFNQTDDNAKVDLIIGRVYFYLLILLYFQIIPLTYFQKQKKEFLKDNC